MGNYYMKGVTVTQDSSPWRTKVPRVFSAQNSMTRAKNFKTSICHTFTSNQLKRCSLYLVSMPRLMILIRTAITKKKQKMLFVPGGFAKLTEHWSSCLCRPTSSPWSACSSVKKSFTSPIHFSMTFESA